MIINNSRATTYLECPRKFYWQYVHDGTGIVLTNVNSNLAWGTIMHHLLAPYYAERDWRDGANDALLAGVPNFHSLDPMDQLYWKQQLEWAGRTMTEYVKWARVHDKFSVLELETEGMVQLGSSCWQCGAAYGVELIDNCKTCGASAHKLVYRTDMLVQETGAVFPIDHKTTSGIGDNYLTQWHYSPQMLLYTKGVRRYHPDADRYQMNFIKKSKQVGVTKLIQCKTCRGAKAKVASCVDCGASGKISRPALKDPPFHREPPIVFQPERLARVEISRIRACNEIERQQLVQIEEEPLDAWQMKPDACFSRGRCPYVDLCWSGNHNTWYNPAEDLTMRYTPREKDYVTLAREEMT